MIFLILVALGIFLSSHFICKRITKDHDKFKKLGLKNPTPLPLIGTNLYLFLGKKGLVERNFELYKMYSGEKLYGTFDFLEPVFYIRDVNLMKRMFITDFNHFQDHRPFADKSDEIIGNSLLLLEGKRWSQMRSSLSPLFTGKKMRDMFELVNHCALNLIEYLAKEQSKKGDIIAYPIRTLLVKASLNIVGSCIFGLNINALKDTEENNDFLKVVKSVQNIHSLRTIIKSTLIQYAPNLARSLNIKFFDKEIYGIYKRLIVDTMNMKKEKNIARPDLIQLLMKLREVNTVGVEEENEKRRLIENDNNETTENPTWTDSDILAQPFIFFFAGFDSTSLLMQFLAYELAANPDVQEKLYKEIYETHLNLKGAPFTYDAMVGMKYMDMVCNEGLRKYPSFPETDRVCVQDYHYKEDDFEIRFKKGDVINVPIVSIQMDEEYFENPEKFYPERFNEENRDQNNMDALLAFGLGPRQCIGVRFALMQVKTIFYHLILNFEITLAEGTEYPLKVAPSVFGIMPAKPIKVKFVSRK